MADYSEFPTTPTAWQEQQSATGRPMTPLTTEDPSRRAAGPTGWRCPGPVLRRPGDHPDGRRGPARAAVRGRRAPLAGPDRRRGGAAGVRTAQGPPPTQLNRRRGREEPGEQPLPGLFRVTGSRDALRAAGTASTLRCMVRAVLLADGRCCSPACAGRGRPAPRAVRTSPASGNWPRGRRTARRSAARRARGDAPAGATARPADVRSATTTAATYRLDGTRVVVRRASAAPRWAASRT